MNEPKFPNHEDQTMTDTISRRTLLPTKNGAIRATIISDTSETAQQAIRCFRGGCYPKMTFKLAAEAAQITIDLFAAHGKTISIQIECLEDAEAKITLDKNHSFK